MRRTLSVGDLQIEYLTWGEGSEVVVAFHGFGRRAEDFTCMLPLLREGQRLVAVNLFGHEGSLFPAERIPSGPLLPEEWGRAFSALLEELGVERADLVGYSLGGRIAMMTSLLLPGRVRSLLLLAPDGLKINWLYRFASGTRLGRQLCRRLIDNPLPLLRMARLLNVLGFLPDRLLRFVQGHLDTRSKRIQVYEVWLIYRYLFPDLRRLAALLGRQVFPVRMLFGRHDTIIPERLGRRFQLLAGRDAVDMRVLDTGHRMLGPHTVRTIRAFQFWP